MVDVSYETFHACLMFLLFQALTINGERFAGLTFRRFHLMKENLHGALHIHLKHLNNAII